MENESETDLKILRCIDDGLDSLGNSGKKAVNYYLERNGIRKEEIPGKPEAFQKGLEGIFGEQGAEIVENWIVKKLSLSFDLRLDPTQSFVKAVRTIKANQKKLLSACKVQEK